MNKIIFITFVVISVVFSECVYAQRGNHHKHFDKEAFFAKRNAFITAEMELTPEEAALFIPLCNELHEKKFEVGHSFRKLSKSLKDRDGVSDAEYLKVIDEGVNVNIKQAQLEKAYYEKFKKILSPQKLYKYRHAEAKFMHMFMKGADKKDENKKK